MLLPTALHNAASEGVFLPVTSSLGYNLYAGNNAEATGLYTMPEGVDLYKDVNGTHWVERQTGRSMNSAEVSAFWRDRALAWMTTHPGDAAALFMRKFLLFFYRGEIDQLGLSMRFYANEYGPVIGIPAAVFPVLLILSAVGLLLAHRDQTATWVPPLFLLVYVLSTTIFFVSGRLRLPILPVLILYAAHALVVLVQRSRDGTASSLRIPIVVGASLVLVVFLLQPEVRQGFEQEYIKLGQAAFNTGAYPEAEIRFRASLKEQVSVDALVNLGNALAAQKHMDEAAGQYKEALKLDSTAALAWFNYGNLRMQTGNPQYAYGYWKKAIEFDPFLSEARRNLGLLLMQAGRFPEALEQLTKYLELEPDAGRRAEIMRDIDRIRQILDQGGAGGAWRSGRSVEER
jgi:tetratricopeptide (TPR) repeat protein